MSVDTLDITKRIGDIRKAYEEASTTKYVNFLVYGGMGTGKTTSLATLPKPLLIHSFDPGGTKSISDEIKKGDIYVECFEKEDYHSPTQFKRWAKTVADYERTGFFKQFQSYAIDSLTALAEMCLFEIVRDKGSKDPDSPELQHYKVQSNRMRNIVASMQSIPCHTAVVGHIEADKDEVSGAIKSVLAITGKLSYKLPILYDEVYVAQTKRSSSGMNYGFLTRNTGIYEARTRIGANNKLDAIEPQNFKEILRKAGLPHEDNKTLLAALSEAG